MSSTAQNGRGAKTRAENGAPTPLIVKILVALGGFAALAIALEGARTWSWWASGVAAGWQFGGLPAAPELFIYPVFFSMVLTLARPAPRTGAAVFLLFGMLWSGLLFLADPAMRAAVHAALPSEQNSAMVQTVRAVLLYALLFAWMYLTYRRILPREDAPKPKPKPDNGKTAKAAAGNGKAG